MGVFRWFSVNREVDRFAKMLAQDIAKRYPPALDNVRGKKVSVDRLTRILEDAYAKAREFREERGLGFYRKAKLGNSFRWELADLGYTKEFVEMATEGLIVSLSRK
ncbi:MAG TPA: hypothetical protein VNL74_05475 [Methylococcus sp.]|nr:hypothetical protein [Methylococcus sp.]